MKELIIKLKEKTGAPDFTMKGFKFMASVLSEATKRNFDHRYLKYNLYEGKSNSRPREGLIDIISIYLGYKSYRDFVDKLKTESDPVLRSMVGEYYCYVRMNMQKGRVLRSPVKIFMNDGHISYHLKGGRLNYEGKLKKHGECLFVLMEAGNKSFYHVYRVGAMPSPRILQGIFSGVSTDFKPIGGRAILMKTNEPFESLKTARIDLDILKKSKRKDERALSIYFKSREENNLSLNSIITTDPEDLNER
jgi:hypothetical protein